MYINYDQASYYNYDIHGNVDTLLHHYRTGAMASFGCNQYKMMTYSYDLISGKVNTVSYQPGKADGFYHRYAYDAENRLTDVYTTTNKAFIGDLNVEDHESAYNYYKHGPLARMVLGQNQVQGLDYLYTLQGWLKGVNSITLLPGNDPGNDGNGLSVLPARDAFGFTLGYYTADYKPISSMVAPTAEAGSYLGAAHKELFNGNINNIAVSLPGFATQLYNYKYDQLNRLTAMDAWKGFTPGSNSWSAITAANAYTERVSYDGNGNILSYRRDGKAGSTEMDRLKYNYIPGTNRLNYIYDSVSSAAYQEDIDVQASGNYAYDPTGNLISDAKEKISAVTWTVYGKIRQITKTSGTVILYSYDASGNRISKSVTVGGVTTVTWYARDAQGNTMAVYSLPASSITLTEQHLYGSSRLGIAAKNVSLTSSVDIPATTVPDLGNTYHEVFVRGEKQYELSNHLGNVLVTVSDKKAAVPDAGNSSLISYYTADIKSAQDYYPFGMRMSGREGLDENCTEELQDRTDTIAHSDFNSGVTTSGYNLHLEF